MHHVDENEMFKDSQKCKTAATGVKVSRPDTGSVVTLWLAEWFVFFMKLTTNNLEFVSQGHGHRDTVLLRACESKIGFMNWGCSSVVKYVLSMYKGLDLIPGAEMKPESLLPPPQNPVDCLPGYDCWVFLQICDGWRQKFTAHGAAGAGRSFHFR